MKILLIDDSAFDLDLLAHHLADLNATDVTCMLHAADALALLADGGERFDIVVCDLQMPGVDGIELVRALARTNYAGDLILATGEDASILRAAEGLARAHGLRLLGGLQKPVTHEALRDLLVRRGDGVATRLRADRTVYDPDDLRRAIAEDEIVCHCQPKVQLATGVIVGVEMLARWHHPDDGLVFPDQFIPAAEAHGLINDLTRAVLNDALAHARRWRQAGLEHSVAVNVSVDDLGRVDLPDVVAGALTQAGVPPSGLLLEVTESRLMQDARTVLDVLTRLRLKRIELSIDDFGTGHSSLAQLLGLPFTELKIDHVFVHGAHDDPQRATILDASLDMARRLGLRSVGEGVEDIDDWNYLRAHGCDFAQGFFIARPMPPAELTDWLPEWERRRRELVVTES